MRAALWPDAARAVRRMIEEGTKPGELVPSARSLSEKAGMSRYVYSKALQVLAATECCSPTSCSSRCERFSTTSSPGSARLSARADPSWSRTGVLGRSGSAALLGRVRQRGQPTCPAGDAPGRSGEGRRPPTGKGRSQGDGLMTACVRLTVRVRSASVTPPAGGCPASGCQATYAARSRSGEVSETWGGWGSNPRPADYEKHAHS